MINLAEHQIKMGRAFDLISACSPLLEDNDLTVLNNTHNRLLAGLNEVAESYQALNDELNALPLNEAGRVSKTQLDKLKGCKKQARSCKTTLATMCAMLEAK